MRRFAAALVLLLATAAHAQPARTPGRADAASLRTLLTGLGYQPHEAGNGVNGDYEIVVRVSDGLTITTRVTLSRDGSLVWLVAWLRSVPRGRTINGNAVLDMLQENDQIGPTHFSYSESESGRWFFLNRPIVNQDLTVDRLRSELTQLVGIVVRTEALWNPDRWR